MNKQIFLDEFHIAQKTARIAFLEIEIQKIKSGITKSGFARAFKRNPFGV